MPPFSKSTTTDEIILRQIMAADCKVLRRRERQSEDLCTPQQKRDAINAARRERRAFLKSQPAIVPPIANQRAAHG
jgi:hypothetical protein